MTGVVERAFEVARQATAAGRGRVAMPEADEPRIAEAAARLVAEGLAEPVFPDASGPPERYLPYLLRSRPRLKPELALRMLDRPMFRAAAMVAAGEAEVLVAGAATATRRVIEATAMTIGMAAGVTTPSSFFLMLLPDGRALVLADCAVNPAPDAAMLADIGRASCCSARALLGHAQIAMLSFSTLSSGAGPSVDAVRAATEALQAEGLPAIGPVQADAALDPVIAERKGLVGGGNANVLIFPSLDAGNIAYKLLQHLGGAQALGPFLQGFACPVCDLSRGARVDDIVAATAITLARASPASLDHAALGPV